MLGYLPCHNLLIILIKCLLYFILGNIQNVLPSLFNNIGCNSWPSFDLITKQNCIHLHMHWAKKNYVWCQTKTKPTCTKQYIIGDSLTETRVQHLPAYWQTWSDRGNMLVPKMLCIFAQLLRLLDVLILYYSDFLKPFFSHIKRITQSSIHLFIH